MDKFNIRKGNLEVRSCDEYLVNSEDYNRAEIVAWSEDNERCDVIAYFIHTSDGFNLKFVRDRPFDVSWMDFMQVAEIGYRLLTEKTKY